MRVAGFERGHRALAAGSALACLVAITAATLLAPPGGHAGDDVKSATVAAGPIVFQDVAAPAGISFRFETGSRGKHDLPEVMGGGVAILDADGDGLPDLYFCNGGPIGDPAGKPDPPCRLYRNKGNWHFEDITERAGAPGPSYAMGTAVGDYDGDGRDDLFVTGWRDQRLYRNLGGGKFEDATRAPACPRTHGVPRRPSPISTATATRISTSRLMSTMTPMIPLSARHPTAGATTADPRTSAPSPIGCIATTATGHSPTSPGKPAST